MCLLFPLFILPLLLRFLSLCVQLTLFLVHYFEAIIIFHPTACNYGTKCCFLYTTPHPLLPFFLPLGFLAMIVVSIIPLISTPFFLSHLVSLLYFVFIVIPFIPFMPFCSIFLFGATFTTFLPFPYFIFMFPLINAALA